MRALTFVVETRYGSRLPPNRQTPAVRALNNQLAPAAQFPTPSEAWLIF